MQYLPKVMEKEKAKQAFEEASRSSTHSATLSGGGEDAHEIKMDKIPAQAPTLTIAELLHGRSI